jgi:hypothetical protein
VALFSRAKLTALRQALSVATVSMKLGYRNTMTPSSSILYAAMRTLSHSALVTFHPSSPTDSS